VHHLTDLESVKAKHKSLLDHVPPLSKFLEELLGSLVDSNFLPNREAVLLEMLATLLSQLFEVNDLAADTAFNFAFAGGMILSAATRAMAERALNIIIVVGGVISAITVAKMVTSFAPLLHNPKAVPANMAGNMVALASSMSRRCT
jgi:hypothetical protein